MSENSNTKPGNFLEFDPTGDSTILRFSLSPDRAEALLRTLDLGSSPPIDLLDEVQFLISPAALKRAYDEVPFPENYPEESGINDH